MKRRTGGKGKVVSNRWIAGRNRAPHLEGGAVLTRHSIGNGLRVPANVVRRTDPIRGRSATCASGFLTAIGSRGTRTPGCFICVACVAPLSRGSSRKSSICLGSGAAPACTLERLPLLAGRERQQSSRVPDDGWLMVGAGWPAHPAPRGQEILGSVQPVSGT